MNSSKLHRKEREWKPKMKERGRKPTVAESGSSQAAHLAMDNLKDIGRRRDRGQEIDEAYLAKVRQAIDPKAAERDQIAAGDDRPGFSSTNIALLAVSCVAAAAVLVAIFLDSSHTVRGTVFLDEQPMPGVLLRFHPADSSDRPPLPTMASKNGTFRVVDLPSDTYKITLHAPGESGLHVPPAYTKPASTPFEMEISGNRSDIELHAVYKKPAR